MSVQIRTMDFRGSLDNVGHAAASHHEIDMDEVQKRLNRVVKKELAAMGFVLPKESDKDSPIWEVHMSVRL